MRQIVDESANPEGTLSPRARASPRDHAHTSARVSASASAHTAPHGIALAHAVIHHARSFAHASVHASAQGDPSCCTSASTSIATLFAHGHACAHPSDSVKPAMPPASCRPIRTRLDSYANNADSLPSPVAPDSDSMPRCSQLVKVGSKQPEDASEGRPSNGRRSNIIAYSDFVENVLPKIGPLLSISASSSLESLSTRRRGQSDAFHVLKTEPCSTNYALPCQTTVRPSFHLLLHPSTRFVSIRGNPKRLITGPSYTTLCAVLTSGSAAYRRKPRFLVEFGTLDRLSRLLRHDRMRRVVRLCSRHGSSPPSHTVDVR